MSLCAAHAKRMHASFVQATIGGAVLLETGSSLTFAEDAYFSANSAVVLKICLSLPCQISYSILVGTLSDHLTLSRLLHFPER